MTVVMEALHRELPQHERYPLPPREITKDVASAAGVEPHLTPRERFAFTILAHFGMGTAAGAAYGCVSKSIPLPTVAAGAAWGMTVWAGNYLGLLPALGILKPATQHPPRRNGLMIAAHLVWGVTTALAVEATRSKNDV
jgi:uncharacterized membrane protein YagU involved in acid resistance